MARTSNVFKIMGRVGNVVFCERNGKPYVRVTPMQIHDPKTSKQLTYRSKFRVAVRFYQKVKDTAIRDILNVSAKGITSTGYALCMKLNMHAFKENGKIGDFSLIRFSAGRRACAYRLTGEADVENRVILRWQNNENLELAEKEDRLKVIVIYGNREFAPSLVAEVNARRKDQVAAFRLSRKPGVKAHLYCFFSSPGETEYSNTQYLCL